MASTKSELVKEHVLALIEGGVAPHHRLPAERELADSLSLNRLTVRRALDDLEQAGVIYRVQGAGTFVRERRVSKSFELTSFTEDMRSRGMVPGSSGTSIAVEPAGMTTGYALRLSPSDRVVRVTRVRTAEEEPMCFETSAFPAAIVDGLAEAGFTGSLYETLSSRYGIDFQHADQVVKACVLEPSIAESLDVPPFSPALHVVRTSFDAHDRRIEYAESYYRGDRYSYDIAVNRPAG